MARPLRIEFPGAVYHVASRGNARSPIFEDDQDRKRFLAVLDEAVKRFNWLCHAYYLMDNHYHLLVETIDSNLSVGMRHINGVYTQAYNRIGGKEFIEKIMPILKDKSKLTEIPKRERLVFRPSLEQLLPLEEKTTKGKRNQAIQSAYIDYGYTLSEIARHLGLHYVTISRIVKAGLS